MGALVKSRTCEGGIGAIPRLDQPSLAILENYCVLSLSILKSSELTRVAGICQSYKGCQKLDASNPSVENHVRVSTVRRGALTVKHQLGHYLEIYTKENGRKGLAKILSRITKM